MSLVIASAGWGLWVWTLVSDLQEPQDPIWQACQYYTTVLRPLYRTTCISRHPQSRTGGFSWNKVLLPACHVRHNVHNVFIMSVIVLMLLKLFRY